MCYRVDQLEILAFKITTFGSGEDDYRMTIMAIHHHFDIHAKGRGMPLLVFFFQMIMSFVAV
jgi:hypothetical protein